MNQLNHSANIIAQTAILESAVSELVIMFPGTNKMLWFDAVLMHHQSRTVDKSATAVAWVGLAKEGRLQVLPNSLRRLVVTVV